MYVHHFISKLLTSKMRYILLLIELFFTATVVRASISSEITVSTNDTNIFGTEKHNITDDERNGFQVLDEQLKKYINISEGKAPDYVYVRSPTPPHGDMYAKKWRDPKFVDAIRVIVEPKNMKILNNYTESAMLRREFFENNSTNPVECTGLLNTHTEHKATHSWIQNHSIRFGFELDWKMHYFDVEGVEHISMEYKVQFGESHTESRMIKSSAPNTVKVSLSPGTSAVATIEAKKTTVNVEIDYQIRLDGWVTSYFNEEIRDSYRWAHKIISLLRNASIPTHWESKELIEIVFYSDIRVVIRDDITKSGIQELVVDAE